MRYLLRTLQAAFVTFTRLPLASARLQQQHFTHAHYFLPLTGLVTGLVMAATYQLLTLYLSPASSAFLALFCGILFTGALHEDGFADCCDGFGGGKNREHILAIMKDSRLGSFGVLGLIALLGCKITLLLEMPPQYHANAFITLSVAARITPLLIMACLPYVAQQTSKMTQELNIQPLPLCLSLLFTGLCLQILHPLDFTLYLSVLVICITLYGRHYLAQRLQGYNGDCLGASEQVTECAILLLMAVYY